MLYMDFDIIHVPHRTSYELHYIDRISMAQPLRRTRKLNNNFFSSILQYIMKKLTYKPLTFRPIFG